MVTDITSFEKHYKNSSGNILTFYLHLVKYRFKNMFRKESLTRSSTVHYMHYTSTVWPSDHQKDDRSCAWPFYSLVHNALSVAVWLTRRSGLYDGPCLNLLRRDRVLIPVHYWLLVRTSSAFGPELAYRLRVAQSTSMDVPRFGFDIILYYYICFCTIFLWPLRFSWLLVLSFYNEDYVQILNVCPFDYTAVAFDGTVGNL